MNSYNEEISATAYKAIWDTVIQKMINRYKTECVQSIEIKPNAYNLIWDNYNDFKSQCRLNYMENKSGLLDRHKVCACLIYSIVKSSIISESVPKDKKGKYFSIINEDLALTTGLSLLRAFIESSLRSEKEDVVKQKYLLSRIENGLTYPMANHEKYRDNFLRELHYTKIDGNYNILSLAHSLFLLETYTLYCNYNDEQPC